MSTKPILDISEIKSLLDSDFQEAFLLWKNGGRFYRAAQSRGRCALVTPLPRVAADAGNEYTLLISDILPSWRDFPKRNYCIICAGLRKSAEEYLAPGKSVYCVLPRNGSRVAIAPSPDMWDSFPVLKKYGVETISDFNIELDAFLASVSCLTLSQAARLFAESDAGAVLKLFGGIDAAPRPVNVGGVAGTLGCFLASGLNDGRTIISLLDELLSPRANGFISAPLAEIRTITTEAWTSSECLFLDEALLQSLAGKH